MKRFILILFLFFLRLSLSAQDHSHSDMPDSVLLSMGECGEVLRLHRKAHETHLYFAHQADSLRACIFVRPMGRKDKAVLGRLPFYCVNPVPHDLYTQVRAIKPELLRLVIDMLPSLYTLEREYDRHQAILNKAALWAKDVGFLEPKDTSHHGLPLELQLYELRAGDTLVDIGAGNGNFEKALSKHCDSLTVYVNEVLPKWVDYLQCELALLSYLDKKDIVYQTRLGSDTSTYLPSQSVHKVIIKNTFHHFDCPNEMLVDVKKILKKDGKLYIVETLREEAVESSFCPLAMSRPVLFQYLRQNGFRFLSEQKLDYRSFRFFEFERE